MKFLPSVYLALGFAAYGSAYSATKGGSSSIKNFNGSGGNSGSSSSKYSSSPPVHLDMFMVNNVASQMERELNAMYGNAMNSAMSKAPKYPSSIGSTKNSMQSGMYGNGDRSTKSGNRSNRENEPMSSIFAHSSGDSTIPTIPTYSENSSPPTKSIHSSSNSYGDNERMIANDYGERKSSQMKTSSMYQSKSVPSMYDSSDDTKSMTKSGAMKLLYDSAVDSPKSSMATLSMFGGGESMMSSFNEKEAGMMKKNEFETNDASSIKGGSSMHQQSNSSPINSYKMMMEKMKQHQQHQMPSKNAPSQRQQKLEQSSEQQQQQPTPMMLMMMNYVDQKINKQSSQAQSREEPSIEQIPESMMAYAPPMNMKMQQIEQTQEIRNEDGDSMMDNYGNNISEKSMPIQAAIHTRQTVEYKEVSMEPSKTQPQTILVETKNIPINILFHSKSSPLNIKNEHTPAEPMVQETESQDEPQRLVHRVTKPIIQEVYEIIMPYRKITQEIQPVQEEIQTLVSRNANQDSNSATGGNMAKQNIANMNSNSYSIHSMPRAYLSESQDNEHDKSSQQMNIFPAHLMNERPTLEMMLAQMGLSKKTTQSNMKEDEQKVESAEKNRQQMMEALPLVDMLDETTTTTSPDSDELNMGQEEEVEMPKMDTAKMLREIMVYSGTVPMLGGAKISTEYTAPAKNSENSKY